MRLNATQVMGAGILAALALVNACGIVHASPTPDGAARAAVRDNGVTYRPFIRCVMGNTSHRSWRVYTHEFVGRKCRASDGEVWFAGWSFTRSEYVTGP